MLSGRNLELQSLCGGRSERVGMSSAEIFSFPRIGDSSVLKARSEEGRLASGMWKTGGTEA